MYSSLLIAKQFLLAGFGKGLKNDKQVRISLKILSLNYLSAVVVRHVRVINQSVCSRNCFFNDFYKKF